MTPTPLEASGGAVALPLQSQLERIRSRGRIRGALPLLGPAFVAAVAYVDPGNFATNIPAGAKHGYTLIWVVLAANLIAMLVQTLSAKLGIATGRNLPELCRETLPRPASWALWAQAEVVAMATDLAEFVGAAIGLNLLFGVPLFVAGLMTAVVAFAILALQGRGYRRFEVAIVGLLGLVVAGFLYDTLRIGPSASGVVHGLVPHFGGGDGLLLATGILGATVMPHVIYLHSALVQDRIEPRDARERRQIFRFQRIDVVIALGIAGAVNLAMLAISARLFHGAAGPAVDSIERAHHALRTLVDPAAALALALALIASGFASSSVGTYAGQIVMQGFIARTIPLVVRRLVTMAPALAVLAIGLDPTRALVISQVVLSFGIPFALIPLVALTSRRDVMGELVNRRATTVAATVVAALIVALNVFLLVHTFAG
jgi:manganese transport protein